MNGDKKGDREPGPSVSDALRQHEAEVVARRQRDFETMQFIRGTAGHARKHPLSVAEFAAELARRIAEDKSEEFSREAARCCSNGRMTLQIPCRGLPYCPLRDPEKIDREALSAAEFSPDLTRRIEEDARRRLAESAQIKRRGFTR